MAVLTAADSSLRDPRRLWMLLATPSAIRSPEFLARNWPGFLSISNPLDDASSILTKGRYRRNSVQSQEKTKARIGLTFILYWVSL
jgi:hypothetical protein